MSPEILHIAGYLTGAALYAMLLVMAVRDRDGDHLTVGTGLLGLGWNAGELGVLAVRTLGWQAAESWLTAASFSSLGLLAAVVVHSVWRGALDDGAPQARLGRPLAVIAYGCAAAAATIHLVAAATGAPVPVPAALMLMTTGLVALSPLLLITTRRQAGGRRATWMTALAVFAISALHLGNFHGPRESWIIELVGHHASIPLAFAILYQQYRFALADLFLKQALTLIVAVAVIFGTWSSIGPALARDPGDPRALALLLGTWMLTLLMFPWLRRGIERFVDRVVLARANYARVVEEIAAVVEARSSEVDVLDGTSAALTTALNASAVRWERRLPAGVLRERDDEVSIPTADAPYYALLVGPLVGGRRLLSDDVAMLERTAFIVSRRIDAIRLTEERYERMLREKEMHALATEAELRALRAQVNPHFLFNALTTIGYLIQAAPARALDTLMRLTTLLRGVLRSDGEFTTLGRERELILSYLQIEQERFEERLVVDVLIPESLWSIPVPSLVLQPLVENAVKHGISTARNGGRIDVVAASENGSGELRLWVKNTGTPFRGRRPPDDGGIGLANLEHRLSAHYGQAARFTLGVVNGETVAEIRVPSDAAPLTLAAGARR